MCNFPPKPRLGTAPPLRLSWGKYHTNPSLRARNWSQQSIPLTEGSPHWSRHISLPDRRSSKEMANKLAGPEVIPDTMPVCSKLASLIYNESARSTLPCVRKYKRFLSSYHYQNIADCLPSLKCVISTKLNETILPSISQWTAKV